MGRIRRTIELAKASWAVLQRDRELMALPVLSFVANLVVFAMHVVVRVTDHQLFARENDDLLLQMPVSFTQAALGAKVQVPTLDGREELTIKPGTQHGAVFRIPDQGLPGLRTAAAATWSSCSWSRSPGSSAASSRSCCVSLPIQKIMTSCPRAVPSGTSSSSPSSKRWPPNRVARRGG